VYENQVNTNILTKNVLSSDIAVWIPSE